MFLETLQLWGKRCYLRTQIRIFCNVQFDQQKLHQQFMQKIFQCANKKIKSSYMNFEICNVITQ